jgi:hypothetical protein
MKIEQEQVRTATAGILVKISYERQYLFAVGYDPKVAIHSVFA